MSHVRLVQVKYKGQVVDKAPMVCTPSPNNEVPTEFDGQIYDIIKVRLSNKNDRSRTFERIHDKYTPPLFSLEHRCEFLMHGDWLLVN